MKALIVIVALFAVAFTVVSAAWSPAPVLSTESPDGTLVLTAAPGFGTWLESQFSAAGSAEACRRPARVKLSREGRTLESVDADDICALPETLEWGQDAVSFRAVIGGQEQLVAWNIL